MTVKYYLLALVFIIIIGCELWFSANFSRWWLIVLIPTLIFLFITARRHKINH
ncbi:hypothetical protein [Loigolactobacillus zhaoyuanensis]|uniref:hypothetical protein n=1 Tax=Loigolactobacillus zhaoyuanensis TaxID=2486017 RepID=UPI00362597EE